MVWGTASSNLACTGLGAVTGLLLARLLGAAGRGSYAAISAYMGLASTVGECGLSAAVCYFVAHRRGDAADVTRTAFRLLLGLGVLCALVGIVIADPLFGDRPRVAELFRYASAAQPVIFVSAAYVFTLQATSLPVWNVIRVSQPLLYAVGLVGLAVGGVVSLGAVVAVLLASCLAQTLLARAAVRRQRAGRGRYRRDLSGRLFRFGLANLAASIPFVVNSQLDQLLLAVLVPAAELGQYAVAVSLSLLSAPIAMAFGNVAMPRIAARLGQSGTAEPGLVRSALLGSFLVGAVPAAGLVVLSPLLLPWLLGPAYGGAVNPLCVLAPGAVLLSCNRVMGDILRGFNQSLVVARCEGGGALCTVMCLAALVPRIGVMGAAVASTASYTVSFLLLGRSVRRVVRAPSGPAGAAVGAAAPAVTDPSAPTVPIDAGAGRVTALLPAAAAQLDGGIP